MEIEINKIKNFENVMPYFMVRSDGTAYIKAHTYTDKNGKVYRIKDKELKLGTDKTHYPRITLKRVDGSTFNINVAYVVAMAFCPNPNNNISIYFKDGNYNNVNYENLEWATAINNPRFDNIPNLENEEWKIISDFPNYKVSNMGRIKSVARDYIQSKNISYIKEAKLLVPTLEECSGYLSVGLTLDGKIKTKRVHRLVAEAFIPNPENKIQVDHIDQNKQNNSVTNLRWVTPKENSNNSNTSAIRMINSDGSEKIFNSVQEASEFTGLKPGSIIAHCSRRSICKDGVKFRYVDEKAKLGAKNRRKGNMFELEVVHKLNAIGFNTVTARSESKKIDNNKIDIIDLNKRLPLNIQTKYCNTTPNYFTIRDKCTDKKLPFTIIWKKATNDGTNSPGTVAIVDIDFFYQLLKVYNENVYSN